MNTLNKSNTVSQSNVNTNEENNMNTINSIEGINAMNNPVNNPSTLDLGVTAMDITSQFSEFFSSTGTLPTEVSTSLAEARAEAIAKHGRVQVERAEQAASIVTLYHMYQEVGTNTELGLEILALAVGKSQWWVNKIKGENGTHGRRYYDALVSVVGSQDHPFLVQFKQAVNTFKYFRMDTLEDKTRQLFKVTLDKANKVVDKELIKELPFTGLVLSVSGNGIKAVVKKGFVLTPIKGQAFTFLRKTSVTLGMDVLNSYLPSVLSSIRIHNERKIIADKELFATEQKVFTKEAYTFSTEDSILQLLLLKQNNIDVKELFNYVKEGKKKTLVLARDSSNPSSASLHRIEVPAHTFSEVYGKSGVTSLNDAKQGFVVPMVTLPRLVEFTKDAEGFDVVVARENVNKTINRFDKQDNAKALWTQKVRVFLVADPTEHKQLNEALVGGDMLTPNSFFLSNGACRVVTDMDQGGIKSTTVPFKGLDNNLAKGDVCVISAAGFKGGMLAALGLAYGNVNLVQNLFEIIEGYSKTDMILDKMREAVLSRLSTMVIAEQEVQGILLELDIKVTNAYTLDNFMRPKTEETELTLEQDKERVLANVEALLEEMESESKSSTGIRAHVAKQKEQNHDFSVAEWIKASLNDGTLVRKPRITKVISQEIQSIAHWYGKETAIEFLESLLQEQAESGIDIDKLYAIQFLGAVDKNILHKVSAQKISEVLLASEFKVTTESALYSKETIKEILQLVGVEDYGWTTVNYQNGSVDLPLGSILLNDIKEQLENNKSYVIVKGLLAELLENIKGMMKEDGSLYPDSNSHLMLKALVQKALLGKNFGYQYTKGYYGVAMPLLGNYGVTAAGITNRDRLEKSDDTWLRMTLSKAPQYFEGMTACYNVLDLDFGHDLNLMLECAVFVNVEIVLMHQNDFDGDMYRISVGKALPFVQTLYNRFNGSFFKEFYEGELEGNLLKSKASQKGYLTEYHEAVFNAVKAKGHIGSYTANSYFYEAAIANLIDTSFDDLKGNEIVVTKEDAYTITSIMKMLIQIEAMDNVKQEGSSTYITEMLFHYKLRSIKGYNGVSEEAAVRNHLNKLYKALLQLVDSKDLVLNADDVKRYVSIIYHTAKSFDSKEFKTLNMFNARVINEKAINNVNDFLVGGDYDPMYDFEDSYLSVVGGFDKESMYYEIIIRTVETLSGNAKIRI